MCGVGGGAVVQVLSGSSAHPICDIILRMFVLHIRCCVVGDGKGAVYVYTVPSDIFSFVFVLFVCLFVCLLLSMLNDLKWCFGLPANLQSCLQHIRGCAKCQLGNPACVSVSMSCKLPVQCCSK